MANGCGSSVGGSLFLPSSPYLYSDTDYSIQSRFSFNLLPTVNGLIFGIFIPGYIFYQVYKMIKSCHCYCKRNDPVANRNQEEDYQPLVGNDDDWIADRMKNPQEYDEQHVPGRMYDVSEEDQEPITIATAATYGSINEAATV